MNNYLRKSLKFIGSGATGRLNENEKGGVHRAVGLLVKHRFLAIVLVFCGFGAAIFEGGTIGILGLAVSILIGEQGTSIGKVAGPIGSHIDNYFESISKGGVFLLLVGIAIFAQAIKSIFVYASQASQIYLAIALKRDIQIEVTDHIMSLSYPQVSRNPAGVLGAIIDESTRVQDFVDILSNVSRAAFMLTAYFVILFAMSLSLTVVTGLVVIILWGILTKLVAVIKSLAKQVTIAKVLAWRWTVEYLNAPRLLRVFNCTTYAGDQINSARDKLLFPERKALAIEAAIKPTIEVFVTVGAGIVLVIGYVLAGDGAVAAIPKLFVFVVVFHRMKSQVQAFSDLRTKFARVLPHLETVEKYLRENTIDSSIGKDSFTVLKKNIVFDGVSFCYESRDVMAVTDLTFSIPCGQTVALIGGSGAGKSTIADLLVGLYQPTKGRILIDGKDLNCLDLSDWRERIGVVDQNVFLLNTSVANNIKFARPDATQDAVAVAARLAHADEFIEKLDESYETLIGDHGYGLSGGQQQRLALARALLRNPDLLILDEATSALDTRSERLIQRALEEMHDERTLLVIAHRLSTITNADHIIVLDEGRIVEQGAKEELLAKRGRFFQLWNLQTDNDPDPDGERNQKV